MRFASNPWLLDRVKNTLVNNQHGFARTLLTKVFFPASNKYPNQLQKQKVPLELFRFNKTYFQLNDNKKFWI